MSREQPVPLSCPFSDSSDARRSSLSHGRRLGYTRPTSMPGSAPLDVLPLWALFMALLLGNLLLDECGFRIGRLRAARRTERESDAAVGTIVTAELGLLAFLLAFSFQIVVSRFDVRRHVLLDEANAIGTSYLRAAMLPDTQGASIRH